MGGKRRETVNPNDEVEELLRATEDEILLRVAENSHAIHKSSSSSPSDDLSRRFNTLKLPSSQKNLSSVPSSCNDAVSLDRSEVEEDLVKVLGPDLSARFSALRASSSSSKYQSPEIRDVLRSDQEESDDEDDVNVDGISQKEVEKVIQWAKDAARLDPSLSDDEDDDSNFDDDLNFDDDDDEDDDQNADNKKEKLESKGKKLR